MWLHIWAYQTSSALVCAARDEIWEQCRGKVEVEAAKARAAGAGSCRADRDNQSGEMSRVPRSPRQRAPEPMTRLMDGGAR